LSKVILITGISTGFGRESSELLSNAGHKVYGTVRKDCKVSEKVNVLKMDLMDASSIENAVKADRKSVV
jgi:NADP-dependent 3-hydroxy acid dehydrogenase YdfG